MTRRMIEVQRMAWMEMMKFDWASAWTFEFSRGKREMGHADFGSKTLRLSKYFVEKASNELIVQVILHELAHIKVGYEAGHGPKWKQACLEVGAKPERLCRIPFEIKAKYVALCPTCKTTWSRHRMSKTMHFQTCRKTEACKAGPFVKWRQVQ